MTDLRMSLSITNFEGERDVEMMIFVIGLILAVVLAVVCYSIHFYKEFKLDERFDIEERRRKVREFRVPPK